MVECNIDAVKAALGVGATADTATADAKLTAKNTVAATDYKDIYWVGDLSNGQNVVIKLKNALNAGGFNLTFSDRGEGTYALALIAHYSVTDLENAPFEITFEGMGTSV